LKDEMVRRLTGCVGSDLAHADYSLLFDIGMQRPDSEVLQGLGIHPEIFPEPTSAVQVAGGLSTRVAAALGLRAGIPVVRGSSDGTTAMYGGGVLQDGTAVLMTGTTDVLMMACGRIPADPSHTLTVNSGMVPGVWLAGGAMGLSGGAIRYLEGLTGANARRLSRAIGRLSPGTDGLMVLPGLTGERSPFWVDGPTGGVLGLTLGHGPEHLLRAAMEGTACRLVHLLDRLRRCGVAPQRLHVAGGWADVEAWNRIRADATGLEARCLRAAEATLLGTAMYCRRAVDGVPLKETSREWVTLDRPVQPRADQTARYRELADLFRAAVVRAARRDDGLAAL
jgi:sugar (pentulose or hexulose) kinase